MKLWSGVVTEHLQACRDFYVRLFQCRVLFDSDWFVLLELGGGEQDDDDHDDEHDDDGCHAENKCFVIFR